jgi:hypothetical protein
MHIALLQAATQISHGDPGATAVGNASPFRMEQVLFNRPNLVTKIEEDTGLGIDDIRTANLNKAEQAMKALAQQYPLDPNSPVYGALQELSAEEFAATALIYSIISELNKQNGGEGDGLFEGMGRYSMLLSRISIATSSTANSLFQFYSKLLRELKIETALNGMTPV